MAVELDRDDGCVVGVALPPSSLRLLALLGPESECARQGGSFTRFKVVESAFSCAVKSGWQVYLVPTRARPDRLCMRCDP